MALVLTMAMPVVASAKSAWEEVSASRPVPTQTAGPETDVSILVSDGYIYVSSDKAVTVKIFSILGQLISQDSLKPGTHRIKLTSRGIYILRAGSATRRITI